MATVNSTETPVFSDWLESKETPVERSPGFFVDPGRLEMLKASHNLSYVKLELA